jgi:hypothetical protein
MFDIILTIIKAITVMLIVAIWSLIILALSINVGKYIISLLG